MDYGAKKIGVALGDTDSGIASPWVILENQGHGDAVKQISLMCEREGVERVVLGVPRLLRDQSGENGQIRTVLRFADDLRAHGIPVDEADETLTSSEARHYLQPGQKDDAVAAAIMLQTHLDRLRNLEESSKIDEN